MIGMPVTVALRGGRYRVVESETGELAETAAGTPADGGGHDSEEKARRQARAINSMTEE